MTLIKDIGYSSKHINDSFLKAALFMVAGIIAIVALKKVILMFFVFGIIMLIIAFINSKHKVFKFYDNHFEVQPNLIGKKHLVKYDNVESFNDVKKHIIITYKDDSKNNKTIKIFKRILEKADTEELKTLVTKNNTHSITS